MSVFLSADSHYSHRNILKYCNRPFSFEEHDKELIKRWNERISNTDTAYFLGDFSWCDHSSIIDQLNFKNMVWILGNHDKSVKQSFFSNNREVKVCPYMHVEKVNGHEITMCHYSMRRWDKAHYGTWHLYGHSHGTLEPYGLSLDVGVDAHDYYPLSFDEVKSFMNNRLASIDYKELGLVKPIAKFD